MSMKNFNDTIGNRTRDFPACSAVPQPTAPPAACPLIYFYLFALSIIFNLNIGHFFMLPLSPPFGITNVCFNF
jgi:hypothetical protein